MKKWIFLLSINLLFLGNIFSQVYLKAGVQGSTPSGLFFSIEYELSPKFAVEVGSASSYNFSEGVGTFIGTSILMNGRFNLFPNKRRLNTYVGGYLRPYFGIEREQTFTFTTGLGTTTTNNSQFKRRVSGVGFGVMVGRKFYHSQRVFFEFNVGLGRNFRRNVFDDKSRESTTDFPFVDAMINLVAGFKL